MSLSLLFRRTRNNVIASSALSVSSCRRRLLGGGCGSSGVGGRLMHEEMLNYQQHSSQFYKHQTFSTSKKMQLVKKDLEKETKNTNSLRAVQIAGQDDYAGIMIGRSSIRPSKPYKSHKQHWIEETGHDWPTECCVEGCTNCASFGTRIFRPGNTSCWIVPTCRSCSARPDNNIDMIQRESFSFQHPFKLKAGTICLEVESINIRSQQVDKDSDKGRWKEMFKLVLAYQKEHGDSNIPQNYVTPDGIKLGAWVRDQRKILKPFMDKEGKVKVGTDDIIQARIDRLNAIGFAWVLRELDWGDYVDLLHHYNAEHGHLHIPQSYVTPDGVKLGKWAHLQRSRLKPFLDINGRVKVGTNDIIQARIDRLNAMGFPWVIRELEWGDYVDLLRHYNAKHGHLRIPQSYVTPNGVKLGSWVSDQRGRLKPFLDTDGKVKVGTDKLNLQRITRLNAVGFVWVIGSGRYDR